MKKLLAILLVALTIIPMLVACQDSSSQPAVTTDGATTAPGETADPFDPGVPQQDFKEWEFKIMCPWPDFWGKDSYNVDEDNGDAIVSAIYTRNRMIEDRFNITITSFTQGYTTYQHQELQPFILAGEDVIDLVAAAYTEAGPSMITKSLVKPWNDVPYINPNQPWWMHDVNETMTILGQKYFLVGDINWFYMAETTVCYFNKVVAAANEPIVGDLYQTVRDGKWTFDVCFNMAKQFSKDNGDGVWDDQDSYGAIQNNIYGTQAFIYCTGIKTCTMDEKGPKFTVATKKMNEIISKCGEFLLENNTCYVDAFDFVEDSEGVDIFFDNRALFYFDLLLNASEFRAEESDFGLLPYPKLDETQTEYVSYNDQWSLSCALPWTASNLERTGSIVESLCALSRKLIRPAYYEKTLMGKVKRDDESEEMLDILFAGIQFDIGKCYGLINPKEAMMNPDMGLASWWRKVESKSFENAWALYAFVYEQVNGVAPERT